MQDLSSNNQKMLLRFARQSIHDFLATGDAPAVPSDAPAEVMQPGGCFVTLTQAGKLRGCVGTFNPEGPLIQAAGRMALAAAFQDSRFAALSKDELAGTKIEISILGPLEKVGSFDEIEIGRHGVMVKLGPRSGTYLPQVAQEQKWSPVEFITHCARDKAGLAPEECGRAEVYRYRVQKVSE